MTDPAFSFLGTLELDARAHLNIHGTSVNTCRLSGDCTRVVYIYIAAKYSS